MGGCLSGVSGLSSSSDLSDLSGLSGLGILHKSRCVSIWGLLFLRG